MEWKSHDVGAETAKPKPSIVIPAKAGIQVSRWRSGADVNPGFPPSRE